MNFLLTIVKKAGLSFGLITTILVLSENAKTQDSPFEPFLGQWSGSGQLFGAEAQFEMNWERVLGNQFVQLTFMNSFMDNDGQEHTFMARAFYKPTDQGHFQGTWFDSQGMIIPLESTFKDSVLTTLWGTPETKEGRTVYRLHADDRIEVDDYISKKGEWKKFGHAVYDRSAIINSK